MTVPGVGPEVAIDPEAVRAALNGALRRIGSRADALARLRLHALLGLAPVDELAVAVAAHQLASGAFAPLATGARPDDAPAPSLARFAACPPGPAPTLVALLVLDDVRALRGEAVERAAAYLEGAQRADGAFAPAPWSSEGDVLALTGLLAGTLARSQCARPAVLERAGAYLTAAFAPERVKGAPWDVLCAFARFFANAAHELSDPGLQWCGRALDEGFRSGALDAVRASRVLTLCDALALPGARTDAAVLLPALLEAAGGGFGGDGRLAQVEATLDGALALLRFAQADLRLRGSEGCGC